MTVYYRTKEAALMRVVNPGAWSDKNLVEIDDDAIKPYKPPKFKVGDRVRTRSGSSAFITEVHAKGYCLKFSEHGYSGLFRESELSLAPTLEDVISDAFWEAMAFSSVDIAKAIRKAFPEAGL